MVASVEEVSSSLVREYLSRKGLKRTIACMDEEHPRTETSINNRSLLRQVLNIEDLYRKNKVQNSPLKTLLEIIVRHHIERHKNDKTTTVSHETGALLSVQTISLTANALAAAAASVINDTKTEDNVTTALVNKQSKRSNTKENQPSSMSLFPEKERPTTHNPSGFLAHDLEEQKGLTSTQDNDSFIQREPEKNTLLNETPQRSRTNRIRRGMMAGPIPQESNRKRQSRRVDISQPLLRKEEENKLSQETLLVTGLHKKSLESNQTGMSSTDCVGGKRELVSERRQSENSFKKVDILKTRKVNVRSNMADLDMSEMVLDDIDDDDDLRELSSVPPLQRPLAENNNVVRPLDQHTATELKAVLLGTSLNCFSVEWRNQPFTFSETHELRYGIVQRKGGPCGVLATVQAFFLKKLLFENPESSGLQRLRPSNAARRKCLVLAVAEILWRAGEEKQATVAITSGVNHFTTAGHYRAEKVFEKIKCFTVDNIKDLQLLLDQHGEQFETGALGCLLLTISAVLSRTIEKVREDMDVSTSTLIGAHGYCTQELVNLLLCGSAVSNVFDNDMELDSGNGNTTLLKGIKRCCDIGLLSLFEHYNIVKVGVHLKTPRFPIWVVCSESHFSVLFCLQRELLTNEDKGLQEFDLYYYDGLANQQEEIRLTVSVGTSSCQDYQDTDLIPPLDLCIRTRWRDAFINWNDTEPIL